MAGFFAAGFVPTLGFLAAGDLTGLVGCFLATGLAGGFFALDGALFAGVFLATGFALGLVVLGWVRGVCFLAAMTRGMLEMVLSVWSASSL